MSNLFGFPQGLSGGSKETEYLSTFNTSRSTDYTTNFDTSQNTNRGTSSGVSRTTSYTSNFQTSKNTQGDAPASTPISQANGNQWYFVTSGGGRGFRFGTYPHSTGRWYLYCTDHAESYVGSQQAAYGQQKGVLWTVSDSDYRNWLNSIIPSNCWMQNHGAFNQSSYWSSLSQKQHMISYDYPGINQALARSRWGCDHLAGFARSIELIYHGFMQKFCEIQGTNYGSTYTDPAIEDQIAGEGVPPAYARGNIFRKRHDSTTPMIIAEGSKPHSNLTWYYDNYGGDVGGYGDFRTASFQNSLPARELGIYYKYNSFRVCVFPNIDDSYSLQTGQNTTGANNFYTQAHGGFEFYGGCDRYVVGNYGWYNTHFDTGQWVSKTTSWTTNYNTNWNSIWGTDQTTQRTTTYNTDILTSHITYG